jgi:tetraacyldisaccharide 4'-kinase
MHIRGWERDCDILRVMSQTLNAIMAGEQRSWAGGLTRAALGALTPGYRAAVAGRNALFDRGWRASVALPRPTIAIGNLTAGGTGKTPVTLDLAQRLMALGHQPAILLRGYKAKAGHSDEAALYRQALAETATPPAVVAHGSRVIGAQRALAQQPGTDVFLLDDAFQHRQVQRDINLVLIDATCPFGYGYLLPRGLLREPVTNLRRADAVLVTRCDQVEPSTLTSLDQTIVNTLGRPPLAHLAHRWTGWQDQTQSWPIEALAEQPVAAACGIGNPQAFAAMLRQSVGRLLWCQALDDHAAPTRAALLALLQSAERSGAQAMVTTDKDWIKWQARLTVQDLPLPIYRPQLRVHYHDGEASLQALLQRTLTASVTSAQ